MYYLDILPFYPLLRKRGVVKYFLVMKKDLHPKDYRFVVFSDEQAGFKFLTRSTAKSEGTVKWTDGEEYPLVKIQISSASHPFFTGEEKIIDTEGRVDRFRMRAEKAKAMREAIGNKVKKAAAESEKREKKVRKKAAAKVAEGKKPAEKVEKKVVKKVVKTAEKTGE